MENNNMEISSVLISLINEYWSNIDELNGVSSLLTSIGRNEFNSIISEIVSNRNREIGLIQGMLDTISQNSEEIEKGKEEAEELLDSEDVVDEEDLDAQAELTEAYISEEEIENDDSLYVMHINGELSELDAEKFVETCFENKMPTHTNRVMGNVVYCITVDPGYFFGEKNKNDKCWIDIVSSDKNNNDQKRILLQSFNTKEDLVSELKEWLEDELGE